MSSLNIVFEALSHSQITVVDLIVTLLASNQYKDSLFTNDLLARSIEVIDAFLQHPVTCDKVRSHVNNIHATTYLEEIHCLASENSGWHFGASNTTTKQLEGFSLEEMSQKMEELAPTWWHLLATLLDGDRLRTQPDLAGRGNDGSAIDGMLEDGESYWDQVDEIDLEGIINELTGEQSPQSRLSIQDRCMKRQSAIRMMKKTFISSVFMHASNQKSNALQSILGFFLQSAHTPYKVIDTLARLGISISTDAINMAVRSLSIESQDSLCHLGQSLLASYAYDNFDVDLKSQVSTVERSGDSLKHLTLGLLFPLGHGVTTNDLRCSEELWRKSLLNPHVDEHLTPQKRTWCDLLYLHPEDTNASLKLSRRDQFNSWMFLQNLCTHGPEYFHQF